MKNIKFLSLILPLVFISTSFANFSDVSNEHSYIEAINYAKENNIVNGYKDWTFQPENKITREEFTKIMIKSNFPDSEIYWEDCFPDVNWWYFEKYICTAKRNGIIWWYKDWTFKPKDNISFLEASKIILLGMWKQEDVWDEEWLVKYWKYLSRRWAIPFSIEAIESTINRWEMVEIIRRLKEDIKYKNSRHVYKDSFFFYIKDWKYYRRDKELVWVDSNSFERLNAIYAKDKDYIYLSWNKIGWIDIESFEMITVYCFKDKNWVYSGNWEIVEWADPETFEIIQFDYWKIIINEYAKDKNNVYLLYRDTIKILDVDRDSFEVIGKFYSYGENIISYDGINNFEFYKWFYLKDKNNVYLSYKLKFLSMNADPDSFEVFSYWYSKDKNSVYHLWEKVDYFNTSTFEVLWWYYVKNNNSIYKNNIINEFLSPESFSYIWGEYIKNKWKVYYNSREVIWADIDSFEYLYLNYAKDKNSIYNSEVKIVWVDTETFEPLNNYYSKDKDYIYYEWSKSEKIDKETFVILERNCWKDINSVYCWLFEPTNTNIDAESFIIIGWNYTKDKDNVYYYDYAGAEHYVIVNDVDLDSFQVISIDYAKDNNNCYNKYSVVDMSECE